MPQSNFIPRRKRSRGVNSVLHIFCEGATEEAYFEAYKRKIHCAAVVIEHSHHGDSKGLVAETINAKDGSPANDIFWVVYDAEELSQRNKLQSHAEAFQAANRNGINIAFSAICFEVWLLLHFIPNPSAFLLPSKAVKELQKYIKNYKKGDLNILTTLQDKLPAAHVDAASLAQRQQRNHPDVPMYEYNPYTTVHLLLDAIDGMAK